jgi:hypothetical protein
VAILVTNVDDSMPNCRLNGNHSLQKQVMQRVFSTIRKWTQEDLTKLFLFVTGSSQVRLGEFAEFRAIGGPVAISTVPGNELLVDSPYMRQCSRSTRV